MLLAVLPCKIGSHAGEAPTRFIEMDNILRQLEGLRRDELVWLNTYLTGRLRALPPSEARMFLYKPPEPFPAPGRCSHI